MSVRNLTNGRSVRVADAIYDYDERRVRAVAATDLGAKPGDFAALVHHLGADCDCVYLRAEI